MFQPTYQDYLALSNYGDAPLRREDWERLDPETQFNMIGGGLILRPNDSRYNDFKPQVGGADGRNVWITPNDVSRLHGGLVNPAAQYRGQGIFAHSEDNQSPSQQAFGHQQGAGMAAVLPLLFLGAGALAGGGLGAGAAGGDMLAAGAGEGFGAGTGAAGGGATAGGFTGMGTGMLDPETMAGAGGMGGEAGGGGGLLGGESGAFDMGGSSGQFGDVFGGANGAGGAAGGGLNMGEGMLDPETMNGAGGMGVSQNGIGPGSLGDRLMGAFNNPSSLLSGNGLLSGMGNMGLSDYIRLAGLAQSASGLFGGGGRTGGGGGGGGEGGGNKGGNGQGLNITRGEYTPNPITAAQLQNFQYAQPRGR